MRDLILKYKLCAILRGMAPDAAASCAAAIYAGGIRMFEVALNSPDAYRQIEALRRSLPEDALIGAGTAITVERAENALAAGASFLLTPSVNHPILAYCRDHAVPLLPGVMTPSEVDLALSYGFSTLKLFPAGDLPMGYIKSLKGPFDGTDYVAVGGVTLENLRAFFDHGFIGAGIGSALTPKDAVVRGDWSAIEALTRRYVEIIG